MKFQKKYSDILVSLRSYVHTAAIWHFSDFDSTRLPRNLVGSIIYQGGVNRFGFGNDFWYLVIVSNKSTILKTFL